MSFDAASPRFQGAYRITRWKELPLSGRRETFVAMPADTIARRKRENNDIYSDMVQPDGTTAESFRYLDGDTLICLKDDAFGRHASDFLKEVEAAKESRDQGFARSTEHLLRDTEGQNSRAQRKLLDQFLESAKTQMESFTQTEKRLKKKYARQATPAEARFVGLYMEDILPLNPPDPPKQLPQRSLL